MKTLRHPPFLIALTAASALVFAGCGEPGSSGADSSAPASSSANAAPACAPVPGEELVVLDDDQSLQTVDNIIPAANAAAIAKDPNILAVVDRVSKSLTTDKLIALNKSVDVERATSAQAAGDYVAREGLTSQSATGTGPVVVGAANFSESATLAEIYAAALRSAGYDVTVTSLDAREVYLPALTSGQLTVFPEYAGTLTEYLNKDINGADADPLASGDVTETLTALTDMGTQRGLVFGDAAAAQDQNAFAVTKAFADKYQVSTLSELAAACSGLLLGAGPECQERTFCQPGLEKTYGIHFAGFTALDSGGPLTKTALRTGEISLGVVFSSDGQLS